jgi:hypothetical protein
MSDGGNAPAWLFSFVDLAFLLLIAMTQLASDETGPELGEIVVPRIERAALAPEQPIAREPWQLRVHPPSAREPFELVRGVSAEAEPGRLDLDALRERLTAVKSAGQGRPLLAPHEDSRSQDLLDAVAALEQLWPGRRRTAVSPVVAHR